MADAWNVTDLQVFDNLALGLDKTVAHAPEIKTEVEVEARKTAALIDDAISEIKQKIAAAQACVESASQSMYSQGYMDEVQYAMQHAPGALSSIARSHIQHSQAAAKPYLAQLDNLQMQLEELERLQRDFQQEQQRFGQEMDSAVSDYSDKVSKSRAILNQCGVLLAQSRSSLQ